MYFSGAMTQNGACPQVGGCAGTDNTPHQAYDQLLWWLRPTRGPPSASWTMTSMNWNS